MRLVRSLCLLALVTSPIGCGAGVVSGAILGRSGGGPTVTEAQPTVTMSIDRGPLVIGVGESYPGAAVLSNIEIPTGAQVVVDFVFEDVVVPQADVVVDQGATGSINWRLVTEPIRARFADPTAQDVPVVVQIRAIRESGEVELLGTGAFTLLRKPTASVPAGVSRTVPISGGPLTLRVSPRLAEQPQVEVFTGPGRTLVARIDNRFDDLLLDETILTLRIPVGETPRELLLTVVDREAGRSTSVNGVFYAPDILAVVNRSGSTDGDEVLALIGDGLIPTVIDSTGMPFEDLTRVEVVFRKGGREIVAASDAFLSQLSTPNALTLRSPPSPDGLPGPVELELRVTVDSSAGGTVVVRDIEGGLFAYAAARPSFEPRGIAIDGRPIAIDYGDLRGDGVTPGPDEVALLFRSPIDTVGLVRALAGLGNGMFARIGPFVPTGDPGNPELLLPISLAVGDFAGDGIEEVATAHLGTGAGSPVTTLLENSVDRLGFLGAFQHLFAAVSRVPRQLAKARLDADATDDLWIASLNDSAYALRGENFTPHWLSLEFPGVLPSGFFVVSEPLDVDDDGRAEPLVVVRGFDSSTWAALVVGDGVNFSIPRPIDLTADFQGYDVRFAVRLDPRLPGNPHRIAVVSTPAEGSPATTSKITVIEVLPDWTLQTVESVPISTTGVTASAALAVDVDGDGAIELVVGSLASGLRVYGTDPVGQLVLEAVIEDFDGERIGEVLDLAWRSVDGVENGLFVTHIPLLDSTQETRITTVLVDDAGEMLSPTAYRELPRSALRLVITDGVGEEMAIVSDDEVRFVRADRFGQWGDVSTVAVPGLVPETVSRLRDDGVSALVFLLQDGRLGLLTSSFSQPAISPAPIFPPELPPGLIVDPASRFESGDFDGDGVLDLALLLVPDIASRGPVAPRPLVAVLRGRLGLPGELPFELDIQLDQGQLIDGATSIAVGNFALDSQNLADEIAVAVPAEGVRFLRFDRETNRLVMANLDPGAAFVAPGRGASIVRAIDLDESGVDDLALVSDSRSQVIFYLQQDPRFGAVNVGGYGRVDEETIPPGTSTQFEVADVDGDELEDFLIVVIDAQGRPVVGALLWDGADRVRSTFGLPTERIGTTAPGVFEPRQFSVAVGDTNRDGTNDLIFAWEANPGQMLPSSVQTLFGGRR